MTLKQRLRALTTRLYNNDDGNSNNNDGTAFLWKKKGISFLTNHRCTMRCIMFCDGQSVSLTRQRESLAPHLTWSITIAKYTCHRRVRQYYIETTPHRRWPPTSCHANVIKHLPITLYNVCIVIDKRRCQTPRKLSLERCLFVLKLGACFCTPEPSAYRLHSIHNRRMAVPTVLDFFIVWTERKCALLSGTRRALGSSLGHRQTVRFGLGSGLAVWWNYPWRHRTRNVEAKRETDTWTGTSYMSTCTNKCLDTMPSMFVRACVRACQNDQMRRELEKRQWNPCG